MTKTLISQKVVRSLIKVLFFATYNSLQYLGEKGINRCLFNIIIIKLIIMII